METKPRTQVLRWGELLAAVIGFAWWSVAPAIFAQEAEVPALIASLSMTTIQSELILSSVREPTNRPILYPAERTDRPVMVWRRKSADTRAWECFEAEFEPQPNNPSPVKRQIEAIKYDLDTVVFALDRFVKNIRHHADFELDQGRLRPTRTDDRGGRRGNPRVKLDLDLTHGKPYVGARVVISFGK